MSEADVTAVVNETPAVPTDTTPESATKLTTEPSAIETVNAVATTTTPTARRSPFADEPYEYERCTLTVTLQFWPADDHAEGRRVLLSARNHQDKPILLLLREQALGPLPDAITQLLEQLRAEF